MTNAPRAFVIGHPIAHSRSPLLHGFWLRHHGLAGRYDKIDVVPDDLPRFLAGLREAGFAGGNVTIPHKTTALAFLDAVDAAAHAIGAVNTLWFDGDQLMGGNTDAIGFTASLDAESPGWDQAAHTAIVLGAGGAARAVIYGLLGRGFDVAVVNRTAASAAALADAFGPRVSGHGWAALPALLGAADLLVNSTSLGMVGKPPLDIELARLRGDAIVCDIVYVPLDTALLVQARERGHRTVGGLGMLLHQAVPGFAHWFGVTPSVTPALRALIENEVRGAGG